MHARLISVPTRDTALITPMDAPARPRAHPFGATLCICMHRGRLGPAAGQRHARTVVGRTLSNRVAGARVHTIVPGQSTAYKVCFGAVPADWGSARQLRRTGTLLSHGGRSPRRLRRVQYWCFPSLAI